MMQQLQQHKPKKVVLYNPTVDYSAPLQQQVNPELIGSHPHVQLHQQQYSNNNNNGNNNNSGQSNQVRQQRSSASASSSAAMQQQQQQPPHMNSAAATTTTTAAVVAVAAPTTSTTTSLPLKLSEQCNISNNLSNASHTFAHELSAMQPLKPGQQQQQLLSGGLLAGGMPADSNGLLTNSSVSSSISNLLNSNNSNLAATSAAATTTTLLATPPPAMSKMHALWAQQPAAMQAELANAYGLGHSNSNNSHNYLNNNNNSNNFNSEAICSLWGCSSNASSTSGCSSGSGSQPSLSPSSTASTRQNYRSNSKDSLWSQPISPTSGGGSNLRDNYYFAAAAKCTAGNTASSPTTSDASSISSTSSSAGLSTGCGSNLWTMNSAGSQSFFAASAVAPIANALSSPIEASAAATSQFAKISNIWEAPNAMPAAIAATPTTTTTRSNDLFTDLWSIFNDSSHAPLANNNNNNSGCGSSSHDNSDASSNASSCAALELDASNIWRATAACSNNAIGVRALNKQQPQQQQATVVGATYAELGNGVQSAVAPAADMQLFSEEFLNYLLEYEKLE